MNFHVGQKVVCIETWENDHPISGYGDEVGPVKGEIYTIRSIQWEEPDTWPSGEVCVRLQEIHNPVRGYRSPVGIEKWEQNFRSSRFRPVKTTETGMAILTALLTPTPVKETV